MNKKSVNHDTLKQRKSILILGCYTFLTSAIVFTVMLFASYAHADAAGISGSVIDDNGAPAAGTTIELLNENGRVVSHAETDASGKFSIPAADAGSYSLKVLKSGFQPVNKSVEFPAGGKPLSISLLPKEDLIVVRADQISRMGVSESGANQYSVTAKDIASLPTGENTSMTDVLSQMPGVAIDQNQQIHIRNTEGPQFQYQINGILVPLDINTNPPFISMINPQFIDRLDLIDGILPSRYSYATGGVVDIKTKDGCTTPGGSLSYTGGQRSVVSPSGEYGGCNGDFSYYVSGLYDQGKTAFSSATPGFNPIHDWTNQSQGFGFFSYKLDDTTKISLITSGAASNNELPNVPGLAPEFDLAGGKDPGSAGIKSSLNFRDSLAMLALNGEPTKNLSYQLAYAFHDISENFNPDKAGELIYQGVASTAQHRDIDHTVEGDLTYKMNDHTLGTGFYFGDYDVTANSSSFVFPVDEAGNQSSNVPSFIANNARRANILSGVYANDLWQINDRWKLNSGLRFDNISGFTNDFQLDPTINLSYLLTPATTVHGGFARYMQVPSFQGISPSAPTAFAGTTAASGMGVVSPLVEDDYEWDVGVVHKLTPNVTLSQDAFYEINRHYLDTGQFGDVPIFAPFNYDEGYIWGTESGVSYKDQDLSSYINVTVGRNQQEGVKTGQFNFDPDELNYIQTHHIMLDHQPLLSVTDGASYNWKQYTFTADTIYNSGLFGGFADKETLPTVFQVNFGAQRSFQVPGIGKVTTKLTLLNAFDKINLIRPSEGIGIFQSAYGPRFTLLYTVTIPLWGGDSGGANAPEPSGGGVGVHY